MLALSTAALIVFHELGVRLGIVTGKGLLTLVRERYGPRRRGARPRRPGDRQHRHPLRGVRRGRGRQATCSAGISRYVSVPARGGRRLAAGPARDRSATSSTSCSRSARSSSPTCSPGFSPTPTGERPPGALSCRACRSIARRSWSPSRPSARRWRRGGWRSSSPTRSTSEPEGQRPPLRADRRDRRRRADRRHRAVRRRRLRGHPARLTCWGYKKEFRPTRIISSPASA